MFAYEQRRERCRFHMRVQNQKNLDGTKTAQSFTEAKKVLHTISKESALSGFGRSSLSSKKNQNQ